MVRDGLLLLVAVETFATIESYLEALTDALRSRDAGAALVRSADRFKSRDRRSVVDYAVRRLDRLHRSDRDEWAYVLGVALRNSARDQSAGPVRVEALRQLSPWAGRPLIFVHFGIGYVEYPILTSDAHRIEPELSASDAPQIIQQGGHSVLEGDSYLAVLGQPRQIIWLDGPRVLNPV